MTDRGDDATFDALRDLPAPPPPPLGAALEAELDALEAVATRRPLRDFARVALLSLAYGAAFLFLLTLRRDLHGLPTWWLIAYGLAWFTGFTALCYLAIVPRPGAVVPRWRAVGIGAGIVALGFVTAGLAMHPSASNSTIYGLARLHRGHACLEIGLTTAIVPVILGALALRGALPVGSRWTAAGLGAAGGSLGGLVLHLHCPIADGWHLGVVHGGVVVVAALLAAALVPKLTDR
ncbi:MAG: DUF1109 family protein [Kofleriaceae bacterium]|nr:DUF1109 family protein [Myxococcales bacterium]MCB9574111.1 DUF1109 family protein [Kofleriaceae bacterium]